jgi:hypothetical protein
MQGRVRLFKKGSHSAGKVRQSREGPSSLERGRAVQGKVRQPSEGSGS